MKFSAMIYVVLHSPPHLQCKSFSFPVFCILPIFFTSAFLSVFPFYLLLLDPSRFLFCLCIHVSYTFRPPIHPSILPSTHPSMFCNCSCFLFGPCFLFLCVPLSFLPCFQILVIYDILPPIYYVPRRSMHSSHFYSCKFVNSVVLLPIRSRQWESYTFLFECLYVLSNFS